MDVNPVTLGSRPGDKVAPNGYRRLSMAEMLGYLELRVEQLRRLLDTLDLRARREVVRAADAILASLTRGGKILIVGNGGSAAEAQHMAAELVGRFQRDRHGLSAIALTTDSSILTAVANDYDYSQVFARQIDALGASGDVLVAISTSGASPSVLQAAYAAQRAGMVTVALLGNYRCELAQQADIALCMPADDAATAQEGHLLVIHVICGLVETALCPNPAAQEDELPMLQGEQL